MSNQEEMDKLRTDVNFLLGFARGSGDRVDNIASRLKHMEQQNSLNVLQSLNDNQTLHMNTWDESMRMLTGRVIKDLMAKLGIDSIDVSFDDIIDKDNGVWIRKETSEKKFIVFNDEPSVVMERRKKRGVVIQKFTNENLAAALVVYLWKTHEEEALDVELDEETIQKYLREYDVKVMRLPNCVSFKVVKR